jgi:hypothetical protein
MKVITAHLRNPQLNKQDIVTISWTLSPVTSRIRIYRNNEITILPFSEIIHPATMVFGH